MRIQTLSAAAALAALLSGQPVAAQEKWEMPTPYADAEFQTQNVRWFAEEVAKRSGGKLAIQVHSAQSLFKNPEIKRAVQSGQVAIGEIFLSNLGAEDAILEVDAIPFLANSYDEAAKLAKAALPFVEDRLMKQGLRPLYLVPWPSQGFLTKKAVDSIDDLKGLKMRAYNAQTSRLAQLMNTVPTTVQATEIPQAFATGIIDTVFTSAQTAVTTKSWDFTKFFYDTAAWLPKNVVFVNERSFQRLAPETRQAVLDAAKAAEARGWELSKVANDSNPKILAQNGMTVAPVSDRFRADLRKVGESMLADWLTKTGADGKKLIDAYRAAM